MEITCKNCNSIFESSNKNRKFCSVSCSTSFNNKNRKGIKRSKKSIKKQIESNKIFWDSEKGKKEKIRRSKQAIKQMSQEKYINIFLSSIKKFKNNKELYQKSLEKKRKTIQEKIKKGEWNTWKSRNIKSFPEIFVENYFNDKSITNYIREKSISKKILGLNERGYYFLDFYFPNKKIDLEIDGSQHNKLERKQSDKKRDKLLKSSGITVIRIKWINLRNKDQLNNFLNKLKEITKII
jgi:very-short-patch-repair endonuclease